MAAHAGLTAPARDLGDRLARERLGVEPTLARDHEARGPHPRVEAEGVEHVGSTRHEPSAVVGP